MKIERHGWSLEFWTSTGCLRIALCRCWDGKFSLFGKTLPLFGFKKEKLTSEIAPVPKRRVRHMTQRVLTLPYLLIYDIRQTGDIVYWEWREPSLTYVLLE